ncbi:hypothetical protein [Luteibacter sp. 9135]|uniref:hypothetical protein n=1 Tax=Luteibacter sp. 9135 TaxID=1500893 RepID=UPI0005615382|nr:hypothetical protein [Luteibacter sp. 9135]
MTRNVALHAGLLAFCLLAGPGRVTAQTQAAVAQPQSEPPQVRLFEGNNTSQNVVCTIGLAEPFSQMFRFQKKDGNCANDEARSIEFERMPPGTVIELYDDPECLTSDDWVKFTFLKRVAHTFASSFQYDFDSGYGSDGDTVYSQRAHYKNGLDGKVSCMKINVPAPPARAE